MAVNVLKQVRKKREAKPKILIKKKQTFSLSNPYGAFYDITLEEATDVIDAYINSLYLIKNDLNEFLGKFQTDSLIKLAKEKYQSHYIESEIGVMNKIKNTVPMSHLLTFLKTLNPHHNASTALGEFYRTNKVLLNNMKELINKRKVVDINIPHKRQVVPRNLEIKQRNFPTIKQTKYDRKLLENMTLQEVAELADKENLSYGGTKRQIINRLLGIFVDFKKGVERKFDREYLPVCEREYRRASWMKKFTKQRIISMLVKDDNQYATKFHAGDGWYRATSAFYRDACKYGREFLIDDVAYLLGSNDIIVETRAMYDESRLSVPDEEIPDNYVLAQKVSDDVVKESGIETLQKTEKLRQELAPGLFRYVRTILAGLSICCDKCNLTVLRPEYKSIDGDKQVVFCSKKCFENYLFGTEDSDDI